MTNKLIMSIDDGCAEDWRIAALARKYGVKTIFYIPVEWHSLAHSKGYEPLSYPQALLLASEFEIGAHTVTHRHLTDISWEEARYEITECKFMMEKLLNTSISKFCPPRGYTTPELTERTLRVYESQRLTRGPGLVHIHPDSGANGNKPWRECITDETTEIWGHSWEIDKFGLWDELEGVLSENALA